MQFDTARIDFTSDVFATLKSPSSICAGFAAMQFFHYLADLDILCRRSFSHHVKIHSFMFMRKISNRVVCDGLVTGGLVLFFSPRLALRDILCSGLLSHQVKIMRKISSRVVCDNGKQPCFFDVLVGVERHRGCLTSLLLKLPSDTEANGKNFF